MRAHAIVVAAAVLAVGLLAYRGAVALRAHAPRDSGEAHAPAVIRTAKVERRSMVERVAFNGSIRPRNEVDVYAKLPGRVERVAFQVGDAVRAGQMLAVIEHAEVGWQAKAAEAAVALAKASYDGAKIEHDRTLALFANGVATQATVDGVRVKLSLAQAQLQQAQAAAGLAAQTLANATVVSPIAGFVTRKLINVGSQVGQQAPVATVQDLATLKLEAAVDAEQYARMGKGSAAVVTVEALPDESFAGRVGVMSPSLDAVTRRASIEIEIDNASGRLMPNMFAHAEVAIGKLDAALAVPRAAVLESAGGAVVYRVKEGRAEAVRPRLGIADGGRVAILEGLSEGDEVAVGALSKLADGAAVKIAASELAAERSRAR